jgi:hypothetical protein
VDDVIEYVIGSNLASRRGEELVCIPPRSGYSAHHRNYMAQTEFVLNEAIGMDSQKFIETKSSYAQISQSYDLAPPYGVFI